MSVSGLPTFLLYVVALMAVAGWGMAFLLWAVARLLRAGNCSFSSSFWFLLGVVPFLAGLLVGGVSLSSAALKGFSLIPDHCEVHPGHPHFCWTHVNSLLPEGIFFWAIFVGGTPVFLYSLVKTGHSVLSMNRKLGLAESTPSHDGFLIIPSRTPAAFRRGVLAAATLFDQLGCSASESERAANCSRARTGAHAETRPFEVAGAANRCLALSRASNGSGRNGRLLPSSNATQRLSRAGPDLRKSH